MPSLIPQTKRDFEDLLILVGTGSTLVAVLPFALYRLLTGDVTLAIVDLIIVAVLTAVFHQTWHHKRVEHLNMLLTISYMGGLFAVLHLKGPDLLYWIYPCIAATYFLLPVRTALPINILCILATFPILLPKVSSIELLSIYPTLALLCIFGFTFSSRAEHQKLRLSQLATEDALTNIENRRSLDIRLDEVVANHSRISQPTAMLILDLDYFKRINDTYGHTTGDKILINFADLIKSNIRITDRLYRFGGEEFILIANNTNLDNAGKLGEFIRELIQNDPGLSKYNVTISIGVTEITDADDRDTWLHRADVALYEAKESGRNMTYLARKDATGSAYVFESFKHYSADGIKRTGNSVVSMQSYAKKSSKHQKDPVSHH